MAHTYTSRRRAEGPARGPEAVPADAQAIGNQSMEALMTGAQTPSVENLGRPVDLPGAIREKMENAFGADLSGVRLYESQAVADAGAQAVAMGNKIGFAPGRLDLASSGGQSLLGHELSHVVSQARGEVSGNGFLNDSALEARADREGAMAAAGESVYSGPVTPLSASSVSSAVGPMQAKKGKEESEDEKYSRRVSELASWSGRVTNKEVSEKERVALDNEILGMIDTPEKMARLSQEVLSQRVAASKQLNQLQGENVAQMGNAFGTMHTKYSQEADKLWNLQELLHTAGMAPGGKGADLVLQVRAGASAMQENAPEDFAAVETAGDILSSDSGKLKRTLDPGDKKRFESKENSLKKRMQNRLASARRPKGK